MTAPKASPLLLVSILFPFLGAIFLILYLFSINPRVQAVSLPLLIIIVVVSLVYHLLHLFSPARKIEHLLQQVKNAAIDEKQAAYLRIYQLYLRLSQRQQGKLYSSIMLLLRDIEAHLHAAKQVETLAEQNLNGSLEQQEAGYAQMHEHYKNLAPDQQQKWYHHLVHLKQRLERGR